MKKIILIIFFVQFIFINQLLSQDTSIVNYYPTKVGNSWVYYYNAFGNQCSCGQYVRISVIGSVLKYGKTYFIFQTTTRQAYNCWESGFDTTRVDSVTGNILRFTETGNCYLPHDIIVDSLRSKIGDSLRNCAQFAEVCTDTGITTVFGLSRQFKRFEAHAIDASWTSEYIRDIGFSRYDVSLVLNCNSQLNLRGCVINGVVYGDTTYTPQDTSIARYFPLAVGNKWVYSCSAFGPSCSCNEKIKMEVTSSIVINSKTYYLFDTKIQIINCIVGGCAFYVPTTDTLRIDPVSGNIYKYSAGGGCIYPFETMIDSLKSNLRDTIHADCQSFSTYTCDDTSSSNIFGSNFKSKTFLMSQFESGWRRRYSKNIGITAGSAFGHDQCFSNYNILGCLVDGVLYGDTSFAEFHSVTGTVRYQDNNQNVSSGYVKAYRHSYLGYMDVLDSAVIQPNGTYTLTLVPAHDTTDLMAFQNDEISSHDFVPTYFVSTIYWQQADHLLLNNDTSGIDISVYRITNDRFGSREISGGVYGYYSGDAWKGISDARLYAVSQSTFRSYDISVETGLYSIDSLPSGQYQIICDRIGFPTQTQDVYLGNTNRNDVNFYFDHLVTVAHENYIPERFWLYQNYPNPFNPVTKIKFDIPAGTSQSAFVQLKIYDVIGKEITTLINEQLKPGSYEFEWDASNYPSGVYFYKLISGTFIKSMKMVLIK